MKSAPGCIPCALEQVLVTAREVTSDAWLHRKVLTEVMGAFPGDFDRAPPELLADVTTAARKVLGVADPFAERREALGREFDALAATVEAEVAAAEDPLAVLCGAIASANVVDALALGRFDLSRAFEEARKKPFAAGEPALLQAELENAERVLYLLDNAGEVVLDRLFIEHLARSGKQVTCGVRTGGLFHDATVENARAAGITVPLCEVGRDALGGQRTGNEDLDRAFEEADLVIAKGAHNYEMFAGAPQNIVFVLMAKCDVVAAAAGVSRGDLALLMD